VWWDETDGESRAIVIGLEKDTKITGLIVQADDNDAYDISYWDERTNSWVLLWHVPPEYSWGLETRPNPEDNTSRFLLTEPIEADRLQITGDQGTSDLLFAVSEIQVFGQ